MELFIDMDEVLADFTGQALAAHGMTRAQFEKVRQPGLWCMAEAMGITLDDFWGPINAGGAAFWAEIPPTPWMGLVVQIAQTVAPDRWYVVSSPSRCPGCYSGKVVWLQRQFGRSFVPRRLVLTAQKHLLAKESHYLIDDSEHNVERFVEAGGVAILFPSRGNHLHYVRDPGAYLRNLLIPKGAANGTESA